MDEELKHMSDNYAVPWSAGCSTKRDLDRALQCIRREAYLAIRKGHHAQHEGPIDKCRKCRPEILKLDA